MVHVAPEAEDRAVDDGEVVAGQGVWSDAFAREVGRQVDGTWRSFDEGDREPTLQSRREVPRDGRGVGRGDDRPMTDAIGGKRPLQESATDAGLLRVGQNEELRELPEPVADDRARIPEGSAGRLVLGEPPCIAGRGQVLEQRPPDVPRRLRGRGRGVRGPTGALPKVVQRRDEDVVGETGVCWGAGTEADHDAAMVRRVRYSPACHRERGPPPIPTTSSRPPTWRRRRRVLRGSCTARPSSPPRPRGPGRSERRAGPSAMGTST